MDEDKDDVALDQVCSVTFNCTMKKEVHNSLRQSECSGAYRRMPGMHLERLCKECLAEQRELTVILTVSGWQSSERK